MIVYTKYNVDSGQGEVTFHYEPVQLVELGEGCVLLCNIVPVFGYKTINLFCKHMM